MKLYTREFFLNFLEKDEKVKEHIESIDGYGNRDHLAIFSYNFKNKICLQNYVYR